MKLMIFVVFWGTAALANLNGNKNLIGISKRGVEGPENWRFKRACQILPNGEQKCDENACLADPVLPQNSKLGSCVVGSCTATCDTGYRLPNRKTKLTMYCRDGVWEIGDSKQQVPNCEPICEGGCTNGGTCVAPNFCDCLKMFRGLQCQYFARRCSTNKLRFNGEIKCDADNERVNCTLSCPEGMSATAPLATSYVCLYNESRFKPRQVGKCLHPHETNAGAQKINK